MDLYREDVMDHYEHPRNKGELTGDCVLTEQETNTSCGDMTQFYLRIEDGKISEAKWNGTGCAITSAAASKLSEYLIGKMVEDIKGMDEDALAKEGIGFAVNVGRIKCLMLPVKVVKKLLAHTPKT